MKVKLITYRISLLNKSSEKQTLSYFNGQEDLLNVVNDYCSYIHKNIRSYIDNLGNNRTFTLDGLPWIEDSQRITYGYFDSAFTGEKIKIKENVTNSLIYDVKTKDLQSRSFFFMLHIPKNSKHAYLVVEKKANHGVKNVLEFSFNEFLKMKGFLDFRITLDYATNSSFINNMIEFGKLKEIKLITNNVKSTFQEQIENIEGVTNSGVSEQIIKFNKRSNIENFKIILSQLYHNNYNEYEKVEISNQFFDEVSFVMSLNDITKTIFIKDKSKIRSNIDVTQQLIFENGEPTTNSMLEVSVNLLRSISLSFDEMLNRKAS